MYIIACKNNKNYILNNKDEFVKHNNHHVHNKKA